VIQSDLCYIPYDQIGNKIYKFALNCVDIATHTKWTYPLTNCDSASVAIGFEKLFNSQKYPLTWPKKDLMVDGGVKFRGDIIRLINKYDINILIANSKESIGIVEKFNKILQE
ncbi:3010_t:CDS:1, partial [Funneliformis geosporum]